MPRRAAYRWWRYVRCPYCRRRFEVFGYGPFHAAKSPAYTLVAERGMTAASLAEATGRTARRVTRAFSGERSFYSALWTVLADRTDEGFANHVRHLAFLDRRRHMAVSQEPPEEDHEHWLWLAGLSVRHLQWHTEKPLRQIVGELKGDEPMTTELKEALVRLGGSELLEDLEWSAGLRSESHEAPTPP